MAAWRRAIALLLGDAELEKLVDRTVANRAGEPGRAGADPAGLLAGTVVFRGGPRARAAPSDGSALCRAGRGRRPDGRAGRSPSPWARADHYRRSQGLGGVLGVRKAQELGYPHELWTTRLLARNASKAVCECIMAFLEMDFTET
jgi:hypothetical protein